MRRPTTADVLEAVRYVTGVDPLTAGRSHSVVRARLLAIHALSEINDLSSPEIGRALGYSDHSTPLKRLSTPVDYDELRAVAAEVSRLIEDEERALEIARWA